MAKLTSAIALELVKRIEALNEQKLAVYKEVNEYDGINNSNVIHDIVEARKAAAESQFEAEGMLSSFDLYDENGDPIGGDTP